MKDKLKKSNIIVKSKKELYFWVSILIITITYFYFGNKKRTKLLESNNVGFAISNIDSWSSGSKMSSWLDYSFVYKGEKFEGNYTPNYNGEVKNKAGEYNYFINKNFLVKFSLKAPRFNELLWNKPVPNDLLECCINDVWNELPF